MWMITQMFFCEAFASVASSRWSRLQINAPLLKYLRTFARAHEVKKLIPYFFLFFFFPPSGFDFFFLPSPSVCFTTNGAPRRKTTMILYIYICIYIRICSSRGGFREGNEVESSRLLPDDASSEAVYSAKGAGDGRRAVAIAGETGVRQGSRRRCFGSLRCFGLATLAFLVTLG